MKALINIRVAGNVVPHLVQELLAEYATYYARNLVWNRFGLAGLVTSSGMHKGESQWYGWRTSSGACLLFKLKMRKAGCILTVYAAGCPNSIPWWVLAPLGNWQSRATVIHSNRENGKKPWVDCEWGNTHPRNRIYRS